MRRSILLVLVAALALAVGMNATASAAGGGAQAAGKKKAAKCKAKGKKGKAGQLLADGAAAKKPKCKAKAKAKPKSKGPATLADGFYEDTKNSVRVTVSGGGKNVELGFPTSCFLYTSEDPVPLQPSGDALKANEDRDILIAGIPGHMTWDLTIKPTLAYTLNLAFQVEVCTASKTVSGGTLVKKG